MHLHPIPLTKHSPLGNSDHSPITLQQTFNSHQDRSSQKVFDYSKSDRDSLRNVFAAYPWYSGFSNDHSSFANFVSSGIELCMNPFVPPSCFPGKTSSPKWLTSQCAKAVRNKDHRFKEWKLHHIRALQLYLYKLVTYAPKLSIIAKPPLSTASTTRLLHVK